MSELTTNWAWRPFGKKHIVSVDFSTNGHVEHWEHAIFLPDDAQRRDCLDRFCRYLADLGVSIPDTARPELLRQLARLGREAADWEPTEGKNAARSLPGQDIRLSWPDPWPHPVHLADILHETQEVIQRHVVLTIEQAWTCALWSAWTWVFDHFPVAPILLITSPTKRCGKTRLFEVVSALVARPLLITASAACAFRLIEQYHPTLCIDETDEVIRQDSDWTLLLNASIYKSTSLVGRCVGDHQEPRGFSAWCPKLLAGIGKLKDTTHDRCIIIHLLRKPPSAKVARWDAAAKEAVGTIARKLFRWKCDLEELHPGEWPMPEAPAELDDRASDLWGPLLAVASLAGPEWTQNAKRAALVLAGEREESELTIRLLADLREVFRLEDYLTASEVVERLARMEASPWATLSRGRPITPHKLAKMLAPFGVNAIHKKCGNVYHRSDFLGLWERYFPENSPSNLHLFTSERNSLSDNDLGGEGLIEGEGAEF